MSEQETTASGSIAALAQKVDRLEADHKMLREELRRWQDRMRVALEDLDALHLKVYGKATP